MVTYEENRDAKVGREAWERRQVISIPRRRRITGPRRTGGRRPKSDCVLKNTNNSNESKSDMDGEETEESHRDEEGDDHDEDAPGGCEALERRQEMRNLRRQGSDRSLNDHNGGGSGSRRASLGDWSDLLDDGTSARSLATGDDFTSSLSDSPSLQQHTETDSSPNTPRYAHQPRQVNQYPDRPQHSLLLPLVSSSAAAVVTPMPPQWPQPQQHHQQQHYSHYNPNGGYYPSAEAIASNDREMPSVSDSDDSDVLSVLSVMGWTEFGGERTSLVASTGYDASEPDEQQQQQEPHQQEQPEDQGVERLWCCAPVTATTTVTAVPTIPSPPCYPRPHQYQCSEPTYQSTQSLEPSHYGPMHLLVLPPVPASAAAIVMPMPPHQPRLQQYQNHHSYDRPNSDYCPPAAAAAAAATAEHDGEMLSVTGSDDAIILVGVEWPELRGRRTSLATRAAPGASERDHQQQQKEVEEVEVLLCAPDTTPTPTPTPTITTVLPRLRSSSILRTGSSFRKSAGAPSSPPLEAPRRNSTRAMRRSVSFTGDIPL